MRRFAAFLRNAMTCGTPPTWPPLLPRGVPALAFAKARRVQRRRTVSSRKVSGVFMASAFVIATALLAECIASFN